MIFTASLIIIYIALPKNSDNKYEYSVGKLWNYDAVITEYELPIFNEPQRQKEIADSLKRTFIPTYYLNNDIATDVINEYATELARSSSLSLLSHKRSQLTATLRDIYKTGVIDSRGATLPPTIKIRISDTERIGDKPSSSFYTFASAHAKMQEAIGSDTMLHRLMSDVTLNIRPNILYDSIANRQTIEGFESFAQAAIKTIPAGTKIVERGDIITPEIYQQLRSYEERASLYNDKANNSHRISAIGSIVIVLILFGMLYAFMSIFRPDYIRNMRVVLLLSLLTTGFVLFSFAMNGSFERGIYMVPYAIIPIVLVVFLDSRTAFFTYLITLLTSAALTHFMWDFLMMQFVAGFVALTTIRELSKRSQLISSALWVFLCYAVTYTAIELMQTGHFDSIDTGMFGALAINAILISFAYILIFVIEKCFGFISRVTLVELSDINHPLLRELSEECPGTFQHSMAVSNIAAAAAGRLGANVQMVRAGALYHDIGKISNPAFFTENQHGINPHNSLSPIQSARIIIGHVTDGIRRAEKAKLPKQLRDFILQHHGRGTARYFYTTYCNQHPDEEVDVTPFTYPGPNPQTIEASILMMADSVEAASRSLKDHSPESIDTLVSKIIDAQVSEGLHNESPISFRDITEIKKSFAATLRTMYHSRIAYPEANKPKNC